MKIVATIGPDIAKQFFRYMEPINRHGHYRKVVHAMLTIRAERSPRSDTSPAPTSPADADGEALQLS